MDWGTLPEVFGKEGRKSDSKPKKLSKKGWFFTLFLPFERHYFLVDFTQKSLIKLFFWEELPLSNQIEKIWPPNWSLNNSNPPFIYQMDWFPPFLAFPYSQKNLPKISSIFY
jgi:hypothetical protein